MPTIPQPPKTTTTTPTTSTTSKRRRFQPPITTFFTTTPTPTTTTTTENDTTTKPPVSHHHYSAATSTPLPVVPATVQSSLLSVGMRVRKSVAEGYKTDMELRKMEEKCAFSGGSGSGASRGIHNIGVHAQPRIPYSSMSLMDRSKPVNPKSVVTDDGDAFSSPASSQESLSSEVDASLSSGFDGGGVGYGYGNRKRTYDDDDDDECYEGYNNDNRLHLHWRRDQTQVHANATHGARPILRPSLGQQRRRFCALNSQTQMLGRDSDSGSGSGSGCMELDGDFEEPLFLRRREEVDADYLMGDA